MPAPRGRARTPFVPADCPHPRLARPTDAVPFAQLSLPEPITCGRVTTHGAHVAVSIDHFFCMALGTSSRRRNLLSATQSRFQCWKGTSDWFTRLRAKRLSADENDGRRLMGRVSSSSISGRAAHNWRERGLEWVRFDEIEMRSTEVTFGQPASTLVNLDRAFRDTM